VGIRPVKIGVVLSFEVFATHIGLVGGKQFHFESNISKPFFFWYNMFHAGKKRVSHQ
jgi:hypothetical protein